MKTTVRTIEILGRTFGAVMLLSAAAFCVFGFQASFEPGAGWPYQEIYAAMGCGCLLGAGAVLGQTKARTLCTLALLALTLFCVFGFVAACRSPGMAAQVAYGVIGGCSSSAVVMIARLKDGAGNLQRFLIYVVLLSLFGAFSTQFFVVCLVPLLQRIFS